MKKAFFFVVVLVVLFMPFANLTAQGQLAPEPPNVSATLAGLDGEQISDGEFAESILLAITKDGKSNVRDAKFIFQECFGGGMLSKLKRYLDDLNVIWVGGSASTFSQPSWGKTSEAPDSFTESLAVQLQTDPQQSLLTSLEIARIGDPFAADGRETPQTDASFNGDRITLPDKAAKSHHAIIWAGTATDPRHVHDARLMANAAGNAWGDNQLGAPPNPNDSIDVFMGDGSNPGGFPGIANVHPADGGDLNTVLANLAAKLNNNEEFFFYATGHGGQMVFPYFFTPSTLPPGETKTFEIYLTQGAIAGSGQLGAAPAIHFTFTFGGTTGTPPLVFLGEQALGQAPQGNSSPGTPVEAVLQVNPNGLEAKNTITVVNPGTGTTLNIDNVNFQTGPVTEFPAPQPTILGTSINGSSTVQPGTWAKFFLDATISTPAGPATVVVNTATWALPNAPNGVSIDPLSGVAMIPEGVTGTMIVESSYEVDGETWTDQKTVEITTAALPSTTTTILSNKPNPSTAGQPVTVTFEVAGSGSELPTGSVTVAASSGQTCSGTLTAGPTASTGSCTITFSAPGSTASLTATYGGDSNNAGSTSPPATQVIN
jgi:hypothetical protein